MSLIGKKGVDLSSLNGAVDMEKIKQAGYEFAMLRCGYGSDIQVQDDTQFENNVRQCEALGMPWGAYLYSYALNTDNAKSEVKHVLRMLRDKRPTLPVAIDMEDADGYKERNGGLNFSNINGTCKIFVEEMRKAGYYPMIYTGLEEIHNYISSEVLNSCDLWFAQWWKRPDYDGDNMGMWQYGGETNYLESNSIPGVGVVDKDKCYKDYPAIIKEGGWNGWGKSDKVLDKTGFGYGDKSDGVLALKEMLFVARKMGIVHKGMDENGWFGEGTRTNVNEVLRRGGYAQNGIAGEGFLKYLGKLMKNSVK